MHDPDGLWQFRVLSSLPKTRSFKECPDLLPQDQLDVIDDNDHLGCGFIHPAFFLKLLGNSQTAQGVFAIQFKKIEPSSVGIAENLLFVREDMDEYKIQLPTSMAKVDESITIPLRAHAVLVIRQCFPSSNQERETADTLTKALPQKIIFRHCQAMCGK